MIDKKFVIQRKSDGLWLQTVYGHSQEIVFVDSFLNAMLFNSREDVIRFGKANDITTANFDLFQLDVSANPVNLIE